MRPRRYSGSARRAALLIAAFLSPAAVAAAGQALQLDVSVNGRPAGLVGAFTRIEGGRLAATRAELREIGIEPGGGDPAGLVPLESLSGLSYRYDEPRQAILIEAAEARRVPKLYGAIELGDAPILPKSDWGGVLNYSLYAASSGRRLREAWSGSGGSATLEARAFSPYGVLSHSAILRSSAGARTDGLRLETLFTYSDTERMITYSAGDIVTSGFSWTRPIRLGGLSISRNFGLRPDLVTLPIASASGSAAVPSTVDLFVNNVRTFSQAVEPGPYRINLPAVTGAGEARLVLRDASGRESQVSLPFFSSPDLLAPGLIDFSFDAGLPRVGFASSSDSYVRTPVGIASLRAGATDWLTLQAHAEGGRDLQNGGVGAVAKAGRFGIVSAAVSASRFEGATGVQLFGAYETAFLGMKLYLSSQRTFGAYADVALLSDRWAGRAGVGGKSGLALFAFQFSDDGKRPAAFANGYSAKPPKAIERAVLSLPLPDWKAGASLSFVNVDQGDRRNSRLLAASVSKTFDRDISLSATAYTEIGGTRSSGILATLSMPLGDNRTLSSSASATRSGLTIGAEASKSLEQEPGSFGWRVRAAQGAQPEQSGSLAYRSGIGTAEVSARRYGESASGSAHFDGAISTLGGGVFLSDRIDNAFAVVETGLPGVKVLHENRPIGRTDRSGRLLVPVLAAYNANKLEIDARELPVDAEVERTKEVVVPADRSGVRMVFAARTSSSAVLSLTDASGRPLPAGSRGRIEGGEAFFVGYDGRAFVRGLAAANKAVVDLPSGPCRAAFAFAPRPGEQVVVGPVACR